jgi:hypothetical protein
MSKAQLVRLQLARRVARAKFVIVLTDKESTIALDGVDPRSFKDIVALHAQAAAIDDFIARLKELQVEHEVAIRKLEGVSSAAISKKKSTKVNRKKG